MNRKAIKVALMIVAALAVALTTSAVMASTKAKTELPEYVGSKACLGCHADEFLMWEPSGHANMLTQVMKPTDLPGDPKAAPAEIKAELDKADWIVAGHRFLARDPATGELKYLNVQWDDASKAYVAYKGGASWNQGCAGCHTTGYDKASATFADAGIGCEMCHGPGRDHILGKGDVSKITATTDAQVCGSCHNGTSQMPDGTRWPVGYRPGQGNFTDGGFTYLKFDISKSAVDYTGKKLRQYAQWEASAHATSWPTLQSNPAAGSYCYKCHTADAIVEGATFDPAKHQGSVSSVTCVACHDPHGSSVEGQLRKEPKALCESCHNGSIAEGGTFKAGSEIHHPMKEMLGGYGAIGVAQTKGAHSGESFDGTEITCLSCHFAYNNHDFKVVTPADAMRTNAAYDSCTKCHTNSSSESRGVFLEMMQESVETKLHALTADIATIDAALKANANVLGAKLEAYQAAKTNVSFVEADASRGAHNFEYATKVLSAAQKAIADAKTALPK